MLICYNVDEPQEFHAKEEKGVTSDHMLYDFICTKFPS